MIDVCCGDVLRREAFVVVCSVKDARVPSRTVYGSRYGRLVGLRPNFQAQGLARTCCLGLGDCPAHRSKLVRREVGGPPIWATSIGSVVGPAVGRAAQGALMYSVRVETGK